MHVDEDEQCGSNPRVRSAPRLALDARVGLRSPGHTSQAVRIRNLSATGCCITLLNRVKVDERLWIKLAGLESIEAIVMWEGEFVAGVRFASPLHPAVLEMLGAKLS